MSQSKFLAYGVPFTTDSSNRVVSNSPFNPREKESWLRLAFNLYEYFKYLLGRGGRMRVTKYRKEELLPLNPEECIDKKKNQYCFAAGNLNCFVNIFL